MSSVASNRIANDSPRPRVAASPRPAYPWLFSRNADIAVFLGSAVVSLLALWVGARAGVLYGDTPDWAWVPAVLMIDVAHVWSTVFRVYLDRDEVARKPALYWLVPILGFALGVALYSEGEQVFWRALAYVAVFHFVRQQYGWVALYRAKAGERDPLGRWVDTLAIYAASVYPLIYWHAHLPRRFWWFMAGDFTALPLLLAKAAAPLYWLAMAAYAAKSLRDWLVERRRNPGKHIVVATTAVCWYVGIVAYNSDYAFTVTNVVIHGVPYFALIYWYGRRRMAQKGGHGVYRIFARGPLLFLASLWAIAYVEELVWDRGVWHDRGWLFGGAWELGGLKMLLVPLLALPQLTHYVLDGFVWRRKNNPDFAPLASTAPAPPPAG
ncbi:MAG TPA: hypothetical protein VJZ91_08510 [Blastocatellia bacterium]|nr:hypothetical protein [Blastocatellia bacterium]